jgi:hypothetical protein
VMSELRKISQSLNVCLMRTEGMENGVRMQPMKLSGRQQIKFKCSRDEHILVKPFSASLQHLTPPHQNGLVQI